jgi:hypothetical protein
MLTLLIDYSNQFHVLLSWLEIGLWMGIGDPILPNLQLSIKLDHLKSERIDKVEAHHMLENKHLLILISKLNIVDTYL